MRARGNLALMRAITTSVVALALLATACGGSDEPAASSTTAVTTTTTAVATTEAPTTTTTAEPTTAPEAPISTTVVVTTAPTATTTTTAAPTTTTEEPGPQRIRVEVYEGLVGGEDHVVVERGTEIEIVVVSDVADEVHVHGYDYKADVAPGADAVITFVADLPGIYEVELEDAGLLLLELEVR